MALTCRIFRFAAVCSAAALASYGAAPAAPIRHDTPARNAGWMSPLGLPAHVLYIANGGTQTVTLYDAATKRTSPAPVGLISQGITNPVALAADAAGNLYIANAATASARGNVQMYARGALSPSATYTTGIIDPAALAVDAKSTLYVANATDTTPGLIVFGPAVVEFASGSTTPLKTVGDPNASSTTAIAVDSASNAYLAYGSYLCCPPSAIDELLSKGKQPTVLGIAPPVEGSQTLSYYGLALDPSGNLLASDHSRVNVFAPSTTVWPKIDAAAGSLAQHGSPASIAFGTTGTTLFVTDATSDNVFEYAYPGGQLVNIFSTAVAKPQSVAVAPPLPAQSRSPQPPAPPAPKPLAGLLYAAVSDHLYGYNLRSFSLQYQNSARVLTAGPLAVLPSGDLYLLNSNYDVVEFNAKLQGLERLDTYICGLGTDMAAAPDGTVAVTQSCGPNSIVVYPQGIADKEQSLPVPASGLVPAGVAVGSDDSVYIGMQLASAGTAIYRYPFVSGQYGAPQLAVSLPTVVGAFAFDANGNVAGAAAGGIDVLQPGASSPTYVIGEGMNISGQLTFDATQHYVAIPSGSTIWIFRYPLGTPYARFSSAGTVLGVGISPPAPPNAPGS